MNCMKCGREIDGEEAFCPSCLTDMERYPVRPGTVIFLPTQDKPVPKKAAPKKKAAPPPEEQITKLKKTVFRLWILIVMLVVIVAGLVFLSGAAITELNVRQLLGQNYSTAQTTGPGTGN